MFVFVMACALLVIFSVLTDRVDNTNGVRMAANFIAGAFLSACAGYAGMIVATDANVRVTQAADKQGMNSALKLAFAGGAVMGFTVVGLGLLGVSCFYLLMTLGGPNNATLVSNISSQEIQTKKINCPPLTHTNLLLLLLFP